MKLIGTCTECKQTFECTNENEFGKGYKCLNGHLTNKDKLNQEFLPLTVDEAHEMTEFLKEGKTHKYNIGTVGRKVGDIVRCKKCGKITDVVEYGGLTNWENTSTTCLCEGDKYKSWYKPCSDDSCKFHDGLDVEKFEKEEEQFKAKKKIVQEIFEKYPPINDGILELNRIIFLFGNCYGKENTGGNYITVHSEFIEYCAEHDLLTK